MKISDVQKICTDMSQYVAMSDDDVDIFDSGNYVITSHGTVMNKYVAFALYLLSCLSCGCYRFSYNDAETIDSLKGFFNERMVFCLAHTDNQSLMKLNKLFEKYIAVCGEIDAFNQEKARNANEDNDGQDVRQLQPEARKISQVIKDACLANANATAKAANEREYLFQKSSTVISPEKYAGFAGA